MPRCAACPRRDSQEWGFRRASPASWWPVAALLFAVAPTVAPAFAPQPVHAASAVEAPRAVSLPETLPAPVEAWPAHGDDRSKTPTVEYMVRRGDSLWKIAEEHLGDGMRFREIVVLNEDVLHGESGLH